MRSLITALAVILCVGQVLSAPNSLVLSTVPTPPLPPPPPPPNQPNNVHPIILQDPGFSRPAELTDGLDANKIPAQPMIYKFNINSTISNRFAKTLVTSKVRNPETTSKEVTFTVVLPEKAFISEFVMEIDGKSYTAYVKEKEEAKNIYDKAVSSGMSAAHVAVSARDSNRFTVSINIEAEKKATFLLTYEELLERRNNNYELVLNIHPGQIVKDMTIDIFINESRPLKFVRTPSMRSGNEIGKNNEKLEPQAEIEVINSTSASVRFEPNEEQQRGFAKELGVKENEGISGQFVLQYDVERGEGGEVLLQDGYFVHFFAPDYLEPLPKHVVFVLDTSGSMYGNKIKQLREAMVSILDELNEADSFHIVEFNTNVYVWDVEKQERVLATIDNEKEPFESLLKKEYPLALQATKENIKKGKEVIEKLVDDSLTSILSSLETALHLVNLDLRKGKAEGTFKQPIIVFLTDGEATVGISNSEEITKIVTNINTQKDQVPIFSLSFGDGADKSFLRKLSLKNNGFSRHIYEAADAALQLQEFYKQISSPLLSNVNFKYTSNVEAVTKKVFPIYFGGCELVLAGRTTDSELKFITTGSNLNGTTTVPSVVETPVSSLERLWAYLTIKQKLEERELAENKTQLTKEALDLALKYSFVTDVSSLVVVKPNDTSAVNTEDASNSNQYGGGGGAFGPLSIHSAGMPGLHYPVPLLYRPATSYDAFSASAFDSDQDSDMLNLRISDDDDDIRIGGYYQPTTNIIMIDPTDPPTPKPPLHIRLPWLQSVLNRNNTLTVKGALLDLGEYASAIASQNCTGTPNNASENGLCTLLSKCPQVFHFLTDFQTYEKFSCQVNNQYAGVCCPQVVTRPHVPVPAGPIP
ncbi:unnamed protein product [Psylliodes chrysocephalus]|uniref:Inter-alpha-trypsin inhibitor heavy chain H4-like n=1 Tax=Psylliodes chrysocephalus TaxID=3402493 RepID=A0A9P0GKC8_9CUCU|nr:unnamed protein product [Psylliodes chrysocephala]